MHRRPTNFIHKKVFQRLSDKFHQEAFNVLKDPDSKLRTYGLLKTDIGMEKYLLQINNIKVRQSYTKLRISNHILNIEKGRHNNTDKELRFCPFCPNQIETETHFLIECKSYNEPRQYLLQTMTDIRPSFTYYTVTEKFIHILSDEFAPLTANFTHNCFSIREFLLASHRNST